MTQRSKELVIPLSGVYALLKDIRDGQVEPLKFPTIWKTDQLSIFFNKLVEEGVATWYELSPTMGKPTIITDLSGGDQLG